MPARDVRISKDELIVALADGRRIAVPLSWYPRLLCGNELERGTWRLTGHGRGIHWPLLDEDISVEGLLKGLPSGESAESLDNWRKGRA